MSQLTPLSYYEILDACQQPGCPLCRLAHRTVHRHLDRVIYDSVNDPPTRARLRASFGYCYDHAWQLTTTGEGTAVGVAFIYADMINTVSKRLEKSRYKRPSRGLFNQVQEKVQREKPAKATEEMVAQLTPAEVCPACVARDKMDALRLVTLTETLTAEDPDLVAALTASDGLCVPHLRRSLELARSETAVSALIAITQQKLRSLHAELHEFIRKNDYRFQDEGFGREADSWLRAVSMMVGTERPDQPQ